jgi:hypothetical protein
MEKRIKEKIKNKGKNNLKLDSTEILDEFRCALSDNNHFFNKSNTFI